MTKCSIDGKRTNKKDRSKKRGKKNQSKSLQSTNGVLDLQKPQQSGLEVETPEEKGDGEKKRKRRHDEIESGKDSAETPSKVNEKQHSVKDKHQFDGFRSPSPILEGTMVGDNMALIDRKSGKVYSSTERKSNGKRKKIGSLDDLGLVVLKKEKRKNNIVNTSSNAKHSGRSHVS
jgi:hypothetical protein